MMTVSTANFKNPTSFTLESVQPDFLYELCKHLSLTDFAALKCTSKTMKFQLDNVVSMDGKSIIIEDCRRFNRIATFFFTKTQWTSRDVDITQKFMDRSSVHNIRVNLILKRMIGSRDFSSLSNENLNELFIFSAEYNDSEILEAILGCNRWMEITQPNFYIAFREALLANHLKIGQLLIGSPQFVDMPIYTLEAGLKTAAKEGYTGIVNLIINCARFEEISQENLLSIYREIRYFFYPEIKKALEQYIHSQNLGLDDDPENLGLHELD